MNFKWMALIKESTRLNGLTRLAGSTRPCKHALRKYGLLAFDENVLEVQCEICERWKHEICECFSTTQEWNNF